MPRQQVALVARVMVSDLFSTPTLTIIQEQPCCLQRHHHTFDMTKVRRSARLAKKPSMLAVERAQHNLWHKLGVSNDDFWPIEEVLQEFISMFAGPLLEQIVAAMTVLFELDDDDDDETTDGMLQYAGEAAEDLLTEQEAVSA